MATAVDLSDGDIERLLQEAEARLSVESKSLTLPTKLDVAKENNKTTTEVASSTTEDIPSKKEVLAVRQPQVKLSNKEFEKVRPNDCLPPANSNAL